MYTTFFSQIKLGKPGFFVFARIFPSIMVWFAGVVHGGLTLATFSSFFDLTGLPHFHRSLDLGYPDPLADCPLPPHPLAFSGGPENWPPRLLLHGYFFFF